MKKKFFAKVSAVMAMMLAVCFAFTGCGGLFGGGNSDDDDQEDNTPKEYTIQYTDAAGTHTLTVTNGALYQLDSVPYKYGYEFLGLYDAETAGTQYVGANGAAVAPYPDNASKVLYPRFKPIDYTVILNYGEAAVTGARSFTVAYDAALPALPTDLTLAHNVFKGWYTQEGCGGTQVADIYGNIPAVAVLNNTNFKPDDVNRRVNLYAGFELQKYAVTFHFGGGLPDETLQIPYGTPIGSVVPTTRNAEKQAVLYWSTRENDTEKQDIFNGKITGARELYAAEWAPVIELDGNGAEVTPIVARAGTAVALPTPTKPLAKFLRWETLGGQTANITQMPTASTTLKAVWQAKIEFDENGGDDVNDISEPAGSSITLPVPEREGYIFAGWYTADKEQYTSSKMPSAGIALKAGWYREKTQTIILSKDSSDSDDWAYFRTDNAEENGPKADWRKTIDLSEYIPKSGARISVTLHYDMKTTDKEYNWLGGFYIYDDPIVSEANLITKKVDTIPASTSWSTYELSFDAMIKSNMLYLCYYANKLKGSVMDNYTYLYFKNIYAAVSYPDTTYLYL